ncbi:MAG TPA: hypothetical protein VIZ28_08400 [Chitinophagaceae bacterium]
MVLQICDDECTKKEPFYWLSCFNEWKAGDYYYPCAAASACLSVYLPQAWQTS